MTANELKKRVLQKNSVEDLDPLHSSNSYAQFSLNMQYFFEMP